VTVFTRGLLLYLLCVGVKRGLSHSGTDIEAVRENGAQQNVKTQEGRRAWQEVRIGGERSMNEADGKKAKRILVGE